MKVTIEISDPLLKRTRRLAAREGVTLNALVEQGLTRVINAMEKPAAFKLRRAAFEGNGLQAEFRDALWEAISEAAYEQCGR